MANDDARTTLARAAETVANIAAYVRGYLQCTKPCPRVGHWYCDHQNPFYHSLCITGYRKSFGRGPYAFWQVVCAELRARKEQQS